MYLSYTYTNVLYCRKSLFIVECLEALILANNSSTATNNGTSSSPVSCHSGVLHRTSNELSSNAANPSNIKQGLCSFNQLVTLKP